MLSKVLLAVTLVTLAVGGCQAIRLTQWTDCGSKEVEWVEVDGCDREPCVFKKGQSVKLTASFKGSE